MPIHLKKWYILVVVVLCICVVASLGLWYFGYIGKAGFDKFFHPLILNVISSMVVIILGLPLFQTFFLNWLERAKNENLTNFWHFGYQKPISVLYGSQEVSRDGEGDPSSSLSVFTAMSYNRLQSLINSELRYNTNLEFSDSRLAEASFWENELTENTIIIGGDRSFPFINELLKELGSNYFQDCVTDPQKRKIFGGGDFFSELSEAGFPSSDACLVTRIDPRDNPSNGAVIIISGNYGVGTFAAVDYFCDPNQLSFPKHDIKDVMQFVLAFKEIDQGFDFNHGNTQLHRVWDRALSTSQWNSIIGNVVPKINMSEAANDDKKQQKRSAAE